MNTACSGIYSDGQIQLNSPLALSNNSPVQVIVIAEQANATDMQEAEQLRKRQAMEEFLELSTSHAVPLSGYHYRRDELYDRY